MRKPTDRGDAWNWWRLNFRSPPEAVPADPQCGLFKIRGRDGQWRAASIDLEQEIDPETRELVTDERLVCFVGGYARDAAETWPYLASNPISREAHAQLMQAPRVSDLSRSVIT